MRTVRLLRFGVLSLGVWILSDGSNGAQETVAKAERTAEMPAPTTASATAGAAASAASAPDVALPTTKALLAKNDEVMGGAGVLSKATTLRMKGLYQTEDGSTFFSIEIFQKTPNKSLFKITWRGGARRV
jgi:hypothetical protein